MIESDTIRIGDVMVRMKDITPRALNPNLLAVHNTDIANRKHITI